MRDHPFRSTPRLITLAVALAVSGCATVPGPPSPKDPWESYNRAMFQFNNRLDQNVLQPVARGYVNVTPDFFRTGVTNFFSNLGDVAILANDIFQLKVSQAGSDTLRILVNTTVGVLGLVDVGTKVGLPKHNEDFGQTLGYWGVGPGPYVMLPLFGPSTVRDTFGRIADIPFGYAYNLNTTNTKRYEIFAFDMVNTRAQYLGVTQTLNEAALDPYTFSRDAFLQRRQSLVYDGNPPRDKDDDDGE